MIAQAAESSETVVARPYLVRIGLYGEPLRCQARFSESPGRLARVVVQTERGEMLADVLRELPDDGTPLDDLTVIVRPASAADLAREAELRERSLRDFEEWRRRIDDWKMHLELVDLEWTLDSQRLMLYVLSDRGPETTKLALQAAATGFGFIDVLPVTAEGMLPDAGGSAGGGCGCGSGGGGCHK